MAHIFFPKLKLRYDMTQDVHNRGTWYLEHGYSLVLPSFSSNITYSLNQVRTEWETRGLCCDCAFLPCKHVSCVHVFSRWTASGQVTVMGSLGVNSPILHLLDQVSSKTLDCGLVWPHPHTCSGPVPHVTAKEEGSVKRHFESWRPSYTKCWGKSDSCRFSYICLILFPCFYRDNMVCGPYQP